jgi:hypothetical protein
MNHKPMLFIILSVVFFVGIELSLRMNHDPDDIDFIFDWCFFDRVVERYLYHLDRQHHEHIPVTKSGFRGTHEGMVGSEDLRIIVTGAGHNFANNIVFGQAWPELLEQKLQKRGTQTDIVNWSMNGSTVVFAKQVLLSDILNSNPSHVIFSHSGYNEAILSHIPDRAVVQPERFLFNVFMSSEAIRVLYRKIYTFHRQNQGIPKQHKVLVSEFRNFYEEMIPLLLQQNIRIILLQQEVITPDIVGFWTREDLNLYRDVFEDLANVFQLPIVDPKNFIDQSPDFYFENQEYYNMKMHTHIADALTNLFPTE